MTAYTANLTITATTAWDTWYSYSERACNDTATVYRWYVATFFSAKAQALYQWIGEMLGCMIALAILYTQRWAEAEVQSCLAADHIPDAEKMVEADPFAPAVNQHYPAMAATIAPAVATLVVTVEATKPVTSAELRRQCQAAGIRWRNAHGKGRHLSKAEMIAALA
jgi:hypothetical protein